MRLRRVAMIAGATASATAMVMLSTGTAEAYSRSTTQSWSSEKGGSAFASVTLSSDSYSVSICDKGTADGYRAIVHLTKGSFSYTAQAANGSGTCGGNANGVSGWLPMPITGTYTLEACLRDGAGGADFNCRSTQFVHDGSM
ncbi:hypothetical protein [Streptomyces sp. AK02-01A]|uniref:hypothetical protein n=1 Tax=Streptomyces sp. AK02-01A TaxID=3028648 RepID=UPI0029BECDF9|nr:hypothetical protein [Streptomyces sp. AK02-01A]MDX3853614.1 hypothetical protein [Streptomyces sp. AK02-01A]